MTSRILRYSGLGLLLTVLAFGPFFRGLFFWTELLAAIVLVSAGFCLWLVGRRLGGLPSGLPGGIVGGALLALLGCYLLQFAWAIFPRGNIDWLLRVAAAWFAYVMMRAEAGPALRRWLGWVFVLSAAAVGFLGFIEFTGYYLKDPSLSQALSIVGLNDRMYTVFAYPNTAAVLLLAAVLAAVGLALDDDLRSWKLAAVGGLITFLSLAFFFTVSRGVVVVFPFGLLLLFLGLDRAKRWPALLLLLGAWAPMILVVGRVGLFSAAHNYVSAFKWISAATVGGAVAGLALAYFLRLRGRLQAGIVGAAVLLGLVGVLVLRPSGGSLLPAQAGRLLDINLQTKNVLLRLIYDQDAARIVADHPLGRGGWGWESSYRQYQAFNYTARETHDHYAQTAVEAGIPGLVALAVAVVGALWAAWQNRGGAAQGWSLAAAAALVAGHSLIDFNLSYGVVWLLLWSLFGASASPTPVWRWEQPALKGAFTVAAGSVVLAGMLFAGSRYTDHAQALAAQEKPNAAAIAKAARQAASYDRWDSVPLLLLGDRASLEKAVRLDAGQAQVHWDLAVVLEQQKDLKGALREAKLTLAVQPMFSVHYSKVASLTGALMVEALRKGDKAEARRLADELVLLAGDFNRRKAVGDPLQPLWPEPALSATPEMQVRYGQALYLTGKAPEAEAYLSQAAKAGQLGAEGEVWLYAIYERRGDKDGMATLENKPGVRSRRQNPVYTVLRDW